MKNGEEIFSAVCKAGCLGNAIAQLGAKQLAVLLKHLAGSTGGVPFLVLGTAQIEASKRFTSSHLA